MEPTCTTTDLIDPSTLSRELGIPERTLSQWRYLGRGPRYVRVGKYVRYSRPDVTSWLASQTVDPASARAVGR